MTTRRTSSGEQQNDERLAAHRDERATDRVRSVLPIIVRLTAGAIAVLGLVACGAAPLDDDGGAVEEDSLPDEDGADQGAVLDDDGEDDLGTAEQPLCSGDCADPSDLPLCSETCDVYSDCSKPCEGSGGTATTCGGVKVCRSCMSTCTASTACNTSCKSGTSITSCGGYGTCKKYDVYCAYPVITSAAISDNNETLNAYAYMYFGSATATKTASFPSKIGGYSYDPLSAWASNFRGPMAVTGESSRTQWEFYGTGAGGLSVGFGSAGTPYIYGKQCLAVTAGSPQPTLTTKTESVYEDDECWGPFCNPDDYVGSFTTDRSECNSDVFATGALHGWSATHAAGVTGDISSVSYKMWCYSCKSSLTNSCSDGSIQ